VSDVLATICAATRRTVEAREEREPRAALEGRAAARPARPGVFTESLSRSNRVNVIAECKRRSPSKGILRSDYDPVAIASGYAAAGAAAISVLTEPSFFDGSLEHLAAVRAAVTTPLLRKDFVVSPYQVLEARAVGADAILLIVAALSKTELCDLTAMAAEWDLDTLVEVHDRGELDIALESGATVIGVNNRSLKTLSVDLGASEAVVAAIPAGVVSVSESGLKTAEDLVRMSRLGYRAFLIGERFMTAPSPGAALGALLADVERAVLGAAAPERTAGA
jgi:indole-3-glycerol phosphate synthase